MLPKKRKIDSSTIKKVLNKGVTYSSPLFSLKVMKNTLNSGFSVSVSSRITETKVERNRIKRRVYNALVPIVKDVRIGQGFIFVKKYPTHVSFKEVSRELLDLFVKAGIRG